MQFSIYLSVEMIHMDVTGKQDLAVAEIGFSPRGVHRLLTNILALYVRCTLLIKGVRMDPFHTSSFALKIGLDILVNVLVIAFFHISIYFVFSLCPIHDKVQNEKR